MSLKKIVNLPSLDYTYVTTWRKNYFIFDNSGFFFIKNY